MKKRIRIFFNFFAFNLLFFALYLNFVYEDAAAAIPLPIPAEKTDIQINPLPTLTLPDVKESAKQSTAHKEAPSSEKEGQALKLSMN